MANIAAQLVASPGRIVRRRYACALQFAVAITGLCLLNPAGAQTKIHKCTADDGSVAYSQLPCVPRKTTNPEKTEPDAKAEPPAPAPTRKALPTNEIVQEDPEQVTDTAACKKHYRDEIDVIDAEIGREYSPEKAEQYKQRLLILTRKLRQC